MCVYAGYLSDSQTIYLKIEKWFAFAFSQCKLFSYELNT